MHVIFPTGLSLAGADPEIKERGGTLSRGNCMLLSAETECSSGALRFGAGEKKLVIFDEAACSRHLGVQSTH